jgi:hypothetical protein
VAEGQPPQLLTTVVSSAAVTATTCHPVISIRGPRWLIVVYLMKSSRHVVSIRRVIRIRRPRWSIVVCLMKNQAGNQQWLGE